MNRNSKDKESMPLVEKFFKVLKRIESFIIGISEEQVQQEVEEFRKIEEHNRQEVIGKNLDLVCPQTIEGEGPS